MGVGDGFVRNEIFHGSHSFSFSFLTFSVGDQTARALKENE